MQQAGNQYKHKVEEINHLETHMPIPIGDYFAPHYIRNRYYFYICTLNVTEPTKIQYLISQRQTAIITILPEISRVKSQSSFIAKKNKLPVSALLCPLFSTSCRSDHFTVSFLFSEDSLLAMFGCYSR